MTRDKHGRLTRTTFKYGGAQVTLVYEDDSTARLIGLYSEDRGKGDAKEVMLEATRHADEHGITIWLEVQRYGDWRESLDNHQLETFYERFGFDLIDDDRRPRWMTRYPLSKGD